MNFLTLVNGLIQRIATIAISTGSADADKIAATNSNGQFDNSFVNWAAPGAIGSTTRNSIRATTIDASGTAHEFGSNTATSASISLNGAASTIRSIVWKSAGLPRFAWYADTGLENGADAGSKLTLSYYSDLGAYKADIFSISRATGQTTFFNYCAFGSIGVGAASFSGAISCNNISSTGTQLSMVPSSAPSGGVVRLTYTAGGFISFVSVGPSSNFQVNHGAAGNANTGFFNSGGSIALQWDAVSSTNYGNVLIGTGTNDGVNKLQVAGSASFSTNVSLGGTLKVSSGGSAIARILLAVSSALDTASFTAAETKMATVTVTGAAISDQVNVNASSATPNANFSVHGYVSAANTVTVVAYNRAATSQNFSGYVRVSVMG